MLTFKDLYDDTIYKYLDDDKFEEDPTVLIPYIKSTYLNRRAYKKAFDKICQKYSYEFASNVISMVTDGVIGIYEPEQYLDRLTNYSDYTSLDMFDRLVKAVNTYEVNQLASIETLTTLVVRVINEKLMEGRTDIRINYLIECMAALHKSMRLKNRNMKGKFKLSKFTIRNNVEKYISLMIDTLSTSKGQFNPITIIIRDKNEWESQDRNFRVYIGDDITINYEEYLNMLRVFMRKFNKKCRSGMLNYPKVYILARVTSSHHKQIYKAIAKYTSSKYAYDDVYKSLLNQGVNITYTGIEIPAVRKKIREVLANTETVEDADKALEAIYSVCRKKTDDIAFVDEDLNDTLNKTIEGKLAYPHHKINRAFYTQKYGFCNWQNILSVSYVNFKRITKRDSIKYETVKERLTEAVINAQMLNMVKKFWYKKDSTYQVCLVSVQYVPEKLIPMVTDILDGIITNMKSTYLTKFDYVIEDDRNFAYIQNSIRKKEKMEREQELEDD